MPRERRWNGKSASRARVRWRRNLRVELPEIEQLAEEVLSAHESTGSPVDPFAIARAEGIQLLPGKYDGCFDGRLEYRRCGDSGTFYLFYAEPEKAFRSEVRV